METARPLVRKLLVYNLLVYSVFGRLFVWCGRVRHIIGKAKAMLTKFPSGIAGNSYVLHMRLEFPRISEIPPWISGIFFSFCRSLWHFKFL